MNLCKKFPRKPLVKEKWYSHQIAHTTFYINDVNAKYFNATHESFSRYAHIHTCIYTCTPKTCVCISFKYKMKYKEHYNLKLFHYLIYFLELQFMLQISQRSMYFYSRYSKYPHINIHKIQIVQMGMPLCVCVCVCGEEVEGYRTLWNFYDYIKLFSYRNVYGYSL